jgi:hypothetical protein
MGMISILNIRKSRIETDRNRLPKNAKEAVQFLQNVLFAESPLPEHQHFWLE